MFIYLCLSCMFIQLFDEGGIRGVMEEEEEDGWRRSGREERKGGSERDE